MNREAGSSATAESRRTAVIEQFRHDTAERAKQLLKLHGNSSMEREVAERMIDAFPTVVPDHRRSFELSAFTDAAEALVRTLMNTQVINEQDVFNGARAARMALAKAYIIVRSEAAVKSRRPQALTA